MKYEVKKINVETKTGTHADAVCAFANLTDIDAVTLGSFDTLEEAQKVFAETYIGVTGKYPFCHEVKVIETAEYDEDGEWVGGGDYITFEIASRN